jgi:hypothetical protein
MEKRDQQQPRQQQPQGMAPFAIEQNWQETVGMSLLSSIGSSMSSPPKGPDYYLAVSGQMHTMDWATPRPLAPSD